MNKVIPVFGAVAILLLLGACAPKVAVPVAEPTSIVDEAELAPSTAEPVPEAPEFQGLEQTFSLTDIDGYTFDVNVDWQPSEFTPDPSGEKPGFTSVRIEHSLQIQLVNTTEGRDIEFANIAGSTDGTPTFAVQAAYALGNPACAFLDAAYTGGTAYGCQIQLGFGRLATLHAGETSDLDVYTGVTGYTAGIAGVPEAQLDAVRTALQIPDGFRIVYFAGDIDRFTPACRTMGGPPAIASIGTCETLRIVPQTPIK